MNTTKTLTAILCAALTLSLCACSKGNTSSDADSSAPSQSQVQTAEASSVPEEAESPYLADLTGDYEKVRSVFEMSDGWSNGSMFNCTWRRSNVAFGDGSMKLTIDSEGAAVPPYSGGEFRSKGFYSFGYYEAEMKPIKNDGVVSSLFTYTGPTDNNPWDEIDIEFLGKDTTKVQFNYFTDGQGGHEYIHELGFDASEEFHTYGFEWKTDSITWYVDGEAVYTATDNIPQTPGKIMANVWPGTGVDGWLNAFDGTVPISAEYRYIDYREER